MWSPKQLTERQRVPGILYWRYTRARQKLDRSINRRRRLLFKVSIGGIEYIYDAHGYYHTVFTGTNLYVNSSI